jgi:hypothetical protein
MNNIEVVEWLIDEYRALLDAENEYREWRKLNPDTHICYYNRRRPSKAKMNRVRIMLQEEMLELERGL